MEVTITLNGKKITDSVDADMVLLDFCKNINVFPSKEDVKPETAGFAAFYWMENQCFPAAFQSDVHQEEK